MNRNSFSRLKHPSNPCVCLSSLIPLLKQDLVKSVVKIIIPLCSFIQDKCPVSVEGRSLFLFYSIDSSLYFSLEFASSDRH